MEWNCTRLIQCFCQVFRTILVRYVAIRRVASEEISFALERVFHALLYINILLTTIDDADKAELEGIGTAS